MRTKRNLRNVLKKICLAAICCIGMLSISSSVQAAPDYDYSIKDAANKIKGNDKVSDAAGIQELLNKAKGSDTVVKIYIPKGTYYVDKTLKIYSNTHVILHEDAIIRRMDSAVDKMLLHNVDQDGQMNQIGGYDMSQNITLEGGTWDGGNIELATKGTNVLRFDHAENITIKNCTVKNTYDCHIMEMVGIKNGLIEGCTFTGFRYKKGKSKDYTYAREAIQLESAWTSNESDLTDTKSAWAKGSVIDGTSCQQFVVKNNYFIDMPCGVGQHRYTKSGKYRNQDITITGNVFECANTYKYCKIAITASGMNNLTITNNTVKGPYRFAVHVIASDDVKIENNTAQNMSINGIMVDSGNVTSIRKNTIKNTKKHGIAVGGGTVKDIVDNTISGTKLNGINVAEGTITNIKNNKVTSAGKHGISLAGATTNQPGGTITNVSQNTISKAKENGICVDAGKIKNITKNKIKSSGKHGISVTGSNKAKKCVKITNISENIISTAKQNGIVANAGKITCIKKNTIKSVKKHGISIIGGTVGSGKKESNGILNNTVTGCGQNGVTVSGTGVVSAITGNKLTSLKNNGISLTGKPKVYWIQKNVIKKCSKHGIWNGTTAKPKMSGNKGKTK